jgi:prepilin-type processing-associated H-X9-DG protein
MANNYVGVSGAVNGLIPGYTESRINTPATSAGCCSGGIISGGGVMVPGLIRLRINGIKDGASNTLMVSEQSDFLTLTDGSQVAWSTGRQHGWMISWRSAATPPNVGNGGDNRTFQMTTVRYGVNAKKGPDNVSGWQNHCGNFGVCDNVGSNIPLNSAHPGGVNAVFADGSVRFLKDNLPVPTLAMLATRDDRQVIPSID